MQNKIKNTVDSWLKQSHYLDIDIDELHCICYLTPMLVLNIYKQKFATYIVALVTVKHLQPSASDIYGLPTVQSSTVQLTRDFLSCFTF